MANPFIGQILGNVLGQAMGRPQRGGPQGDPGGPGGLGGLGGLLGGGAGSAGGLGGLGGLGSLGGLGGGGSPAGGSGGRNALLAMMLPLAMQWVQRSGGVGNVLQRLGQRGYGRQASSWVGTGDNEPIPPQAIDEVVGPDEVSRVSQQLGVGQDEVRDGFAEILPEMVDKLSPDGQLPQDADRVLDAGQGSLGQMLEQLRRQPA